MRQPRLPKGDSPRIIVDSKKAKKQLLEISERNSETLKETLIRIVEKEHKNEN